MLLLVSAFTVAEDDHGELKTVAVRCSTGEQAFQTVSKLEQGNGIPPPFMTCRQRHMKIS